MYHVSRNYLRHSNPDLSENEYIMNLLHTFETQVREAFNMTEEGNGGVGLQNGGKTSFTSCRLLENELCNNFRDKAVSNFGGELFDIFGMKWIYL